MREILETQQKHIAETAAKYEKDDTRQLLLDFGDDEDELRQLEANQRHWAKRLVSLEQELQTEPDRIRERLRGQGHSGSSRWPGLPLAGDGVETMAKDPEATRPSGVARLRAAGGPGRLDPGAGRGPGLRQPQHRPRSPAVPGLSAATTTTSRPGDRRLARLHPGRLRLGAGRPGRLSAATTPARSRLEVALPEYHETLRPTYAVREFEPQGPRHDARG